uniref:RRM domain-containing protein n=1 Tax=Rhabditophanes sp. KR3021 TaxID=114890 RepID=A0AC35TIY5_9BILA
MSRRDNQDLGGGKLYVGNLPDDATPNELESAFGRYGRIRKTWVARRPPGFAFVEFEKTRDAEDAVRHLDGGKVCGVRVRVELAHGRTRNRDDYRRDRSPRDRSRERSPRQSRRNRTPSHSRSRSPVREKESSRSKSKSPEDSKEISEAESPKKWSRENSASRSPADNSRSQTPKAQE